MRRAWICMLAAALAVSCSGGHDGTRASMTMGGPMGERYDACVSQCLLTAPYANPGMLEMYHRRGSEHPHLMRWYGEFTGKYLTAAAQCYAMRPDESLREAGEYVVAQLGAVQDSDGYLGVWPDDQKLGGRRYDGAMTWDIWSHYHNILGLYYWHKVTGSRQALDICLRAADCIWGYLCRDAHSIGDCDNTSIAVGHVFAILYREYGDPRYMEVVQCVLDAMVADGGADYLREGLEGIPMYRMKNRRWEGIHTVQMLASLYRITGEECYREAFANIWHGIADWDRHNTGAFSTRERACGDPFATGPIETCASIAWIAMSVDMLELSGDPAVADELELSTWNALLGAQHPSGRYFTYDTPMEGEKRASYMDIGFQCMAGSPELNCCAVNGPRGFGLLGQWAVSAEDSLTVNYFGSSRIHCKGQNGRRCTVTQEGSYPFGPDIHICISGDCGDGVKLRIPAWSEHTEVTVDGRRVQHVSTGEYLSLGKCRTIDVVFDMSPHIWRGGGEFAGRASVYSGPILLCCDQRLDAAWPGTLPELDPDSLVLSDAECGDGVIPQPCMVVRASDRYGHEVTLCDFASAGQVGTYYTSWLPVGESGGRISCFSAPR